MNNIGFVVVAALLAGCLGYFFGHRAGAAAGHVVVACESEHDPYRYEWNAWDGKIVFLRPGWRVTVTGATVADTLGDDEGETAVCHMACADERIACARQADGVYCWADQ